MHFTVTSFDWVMRQLYIQLPLFLLSAFTSFAIITKLYLFSTDAFLFS